MAVVGCHHLNFGPEKSFIHSSYFWISQFIETTDLPERLGACSSKRVIGTDTKTSQYVMKFIKPLKSRWQLFLAGVGLFMFNDLAEGPNMPAVKHADMSR